MSENLDRSLNEIITSKRVPGRRGRGGRRGAHSGRTAVAAPVGGIKKNTKPARGSVKAAVPSGPAAGNGDSKIIVSNLPPDVSEVQIKEYFGKTVGPVKRAMITYGPNGVSRGVATIIFSKPGSANEAVTQLNGLLVDKRPMKIEVVLDASRAPPPTPAKALGDRIAQPKNKPKSAAAAAKPATNGDTTMRDTNTRGDRGRGRGGRRGRNAGRPKRKTADQLDAEMVDYFDANAANGNTGGDAGANANGGGTATGGDDLGMDEIL